MKKFIKWSLIVLCILIITSIAVLIIIPNFINIDRYKPIIEEKVSKAINRKFVIGKLRLKLFPVAALSFSDLYIGNPKGFKEKKFISLSSFDVQIKVLPLILSKDLQIKKFIMKNPKVFLIKKKNGIVNWKFKKLEKENKKPSQPIALNKNNANQSKKVKSASSISIPFKKLSVNEFYITNAAIIWINKATSKREGITGINLKLKNISFNKPIDIELSAKVEGKPMYIQGKIGPLGIKPGKGMLPLYVTINAFKQLKIFIKGDIKNISSDMPQYNVVLDISPFSPKKLFSQFGKIPFKLSDPNALQKLALSAHIIGTPKYILIKNGILELDNSKMKFYIHAKEFEKPNIAFNIRLNHINVDHYMPITSRNKKVSNSKGKENKKTSKSKTKTATKIDYALLRKLEMDGVINISKLIAKGAVFKNIYTKLIAKNGIIKIDPLKMDIYKGKMFLNSTLDVRKKSPITNISLAINNVHIGKMIRDMLNLNILTGIFNMKAKLKMKGDRPETIISSLNGSGELFVKDGFIIGIDLHGMIQNIKAAFGFGKAKKLQPKTAFSEIRSKFKIINGVFKTKDTHLISSKFKVISKGNANLTKKTLNFRIIPEYIEKSAKTIAVPVIVSGRFSSPHFAPDLKGIAKEFIFKKLFKKKKEKTNEKKSLEDVGKELLRGIFGR